MHGNSAMAVFAAVVALLLLGSAGTAQQDDQEWLRNCERQAERSGRSVFCEVRPATIQLAAGSLEVDAGRNGGVSVRGGGGDHVQVSARIQAQSHSDARARDMAREVRVHARDGQVRAEGPRTADGESWSVSYHVTVPHRADLELTAVNGPISVRDVTGRIRAETRNGPLTLDRLAGDVHARTRNGPVRVALSGSRWDGAGIDAETRNGPVNLAVPEGYSAELETGSVNGPLAVDFPITVMLSGRRASRLQATLGSGGAPVRVVTTNGPVTVNRASDSDSR
jgi:hypothetical protein